MKDMYETDYRLPFADLYSFLSVIGYIVNMN